MSHTFNISCLSISIAVLLMSVSIAKLYSQCVSPPSAMVGFWTGDDNPNDIQSANNGSLQNGASYTTGKIGQAFYFPSGNEWVEIPHDPKYNIQCSFSAACWVYPTSIPDPYSYILHKGVQSNRWILNLANDPTRTIPGPIYNALQVNINDSAFAFSSNNSIMLNSWSHVAFTYDGTSGTIKVYVNGTQNGSSTSSPHTTSYSTPLKICRGLGGGTGMPGKIDEVQVFQRVLSESEIQSIYNSGLCRTQSTCTTPTITTQPSNATKCIGEIVTFAVNSTGPTCLRYQWRKNGSNIIGATNESLTISSINSNDAGSYDVVISTTCGSSITSATAALTVQSPPVVTIQPSSGEIVLVGGDVTFTASTTGMPTPTVQWYVSSNNGEDWSAISGANSTSLTVEDVVVS